MVTILFVSIRTPGLTQAWRMQAFRHLYVLASEPRCVDAVDVHTNERVYVPLHIRLRPGNSPGQAPPGPPTHSAGRRIRHEDLLNMGRPTWYSVCSAPSLVSHNLPCLLGKGFTGSASVRRWILMGSADKRLSKPLESIRGTDMQSYAHNNPVYLIPQFAITGTYAGAGSAELAGTPLTSLGSLNSAEDGNMLRRTAPCLLPEHDQVDIICRAASYLQPCMARISTLPRWPLYVCTDMP